MSPVLENRYIFSFYDNQTLEDSKFYIVDTQLDLLMVEFDANPNDYDALEAVFPQEGHDNTFYTIHASINRTTIMRYDLANDRGVG